MSNLRFAGFQVWEVVVPVRRDILFARPTKRSPYERATDWPQMPIHLVEGRTADGLVAVGESARGESRELVERTLRALLDVELTAVHPATIWASSFQVGGMVAAYPLPSWKLASSRSYSLLESLWLDAMGKAAGVPAYAFLGGATRKAVPVDFWANRPDGATLVRLVKEARRRGLRGMKLKSDGLGDTVRSLVEAAPRIPRDFHFTIDPMCAWRSLRESAHLFDALGRLRFRVQIEDPFAYDVPEDWRLARQRHRLTIICHARTEEVLRWALREEAADALNLGGGAFEFVPMASVARFHGKDCWQGSALELGVLQHVRLHAAAAAPNCLLPSDLQSEWVRAHTLVRPRMAYVDGCALVPEGLGLGVGLDGRALAKYARSRWKVGR